VGLELLGKKYILGPFGAPPSLSLYSPQRSEAAHTHFTPLRLVVACDLLYTSALQSGAHAH